MGILLGFLVIFLHHGVNLFKVIAEIVLDVVRSERLEIPFL